MKTLNYFKNVGLLVLVLICFNCSTESINEPSSNNFESQTFESRGELTTSDPCHYSNTMEIYIGYDFYGVLPAFQTILKDNYENEMSNHFTICSIEQSSCAIYVDKWIVNAKEFNAYNSIKGAGTSNNVVVGVPGLPPPPPLEGCF